MWSGQPRAWGLARQSIGTAIFGVLFLAFAVFWVTMATTMMSGAKAPSILSTVFPLLGTPFVLIGLGMTVSPLLARLRASRTAYFVTDRRAVTIDASAFGSVSVLSYGANDLSNMERVERTDGSGDLVFQRFASYSGARSDAGARKVTMRACGFIGIDDVREVERVVRETLKV